MIENVDQINLQDTKKININKCFLYFIFAGMFLSVVLSSSSTFFSYVDEMITLLLIVYLLNRLIYSQLLRVNFIILFMIFILIISGILGLAISRIERSLFEVLVDIITTVKPFVFFVSTIQICHKMHKSFLKKFLRKSAKTALIVFFLLFIFNLFSSGIFSNETFLGLKNFRLFGFAGNFGILVFSLFGIVLEKNTNILKSLYFWITLILVLFTFKAQAIFFIITFVIFYIYFKFSNRLKLRWIIPIFLLVLPSMLPKILNYFNTTSYSPRKIILTDGLNILINYFPLGSGLATFGSPIAAQSFSPIYTSLGYFRYFGMGLDGELDFLNDNFLSAIIGQFGVIGMFMYGCIIVYLLKLLLLKNEKSILSVFNLSSVISLFSTTIASSFFSAPVGCFLFGVIAVNYIYQTNDKEHYMKYCV